MVVPSTNNTAASSTRKFSQRKSFTLVEILVVVLILSILLAVALPPYLGAIRQSTRQTALSNLQTLINAEQAYRTISSSHEYTTNSANLVATAPGDSRPLNFWPIGPGAHTVYQLYVGPDTRADGIPVAEKNVAACAFEEGATKDDPEGFYGCFAPGEPPPPAN